MNDHERVARGDRAKLLLESAVWNEAWAAYRAVLLNVIETTGDDVKALDARRMLRAASAAKAHLEQFVAEGRVASQDIESAKSRLRLA